MKHYRDIALQALEYLEQISETHYQTKATPHFSGSPGQHMRHVLDHYHAVIEGVDCGLVDYNRRRRNSAVERDLRQARDQWQTLKMQLADIQQYDEKLPVEVESEVSLFDTHSERVRSTLGRELMFVSSHAIHHFSLLAVMASVTGLTVPKNFGIAPATLSFDRIRA